MLYLDHIVVLAESLEEAVDYVETRLGHPMAPGGRHPRFGTHNRLLGLAPQLYIEAISVDPAAPPPPDARWFGLSEFRGPARLDKWICRVDDLDAALNALPMAGRRVDMQRGNLEWAMSVPEDGRLPFDGMFPALIQWRTGVPPGKTMPAESLQLRELVVHHPDAAALQQLLAPFMVVPLLRFETADIPALSARIDTGSGEVSL